jgi:hypothetical protein
VDPGRWRSVWIFQKFADHRRGRTATFNRPNPRSYVTWVHRAHHDLDGNEPAHNRRPGGFGGGGNLRAGYWLDSQRTMAIDGSAFFVQGRSGAISPAPTTLTKTTFINTTPDVFVGLFNDTVTQTVTGATISDQFYGGDVNFRMRTPLFANLPIFDVMLGLRYAALSERLTASANAVATRTFAPALGLPKPVDFTDTVSGSGAFTIRNDFIGPQVGFNAEKHWGPFWVGNESKLAVGAMIEQESASGSTTLTLTPTRTIPWPASR